MDDLRKKLLQEEQGRKERRMKEGKEVNTGGGTKRKGERERSRKGQKEKGEMAKGRKKVKGGLAIWWKEGREEERKR